MREVTATDAARKFSDVLDAVEHRHETFVVTRGGKTVALIAPAPDTPGRAVKDVLRRHELDRTWPSELRKLHAPNVEALAYVRRTGRARGAHDLLIAATALARSRTVVTADAKGFHNLPGLDVRQAH